MSLWSGRDSDLRHFNCLRRRLDHCHGWSICKGLRSHWLYHWFDLCLGSGGSKIYEDCDYGCAISAQGSFRWTGGARETNPANGCPSASEFVQYLDLNPRIENDLESRANVFWGGRFILLALKMHTGLRRTFTYQLNKQPHPVVTHGALFNASTLVLHHGDGVCTINGSWFCTLIRKGWRKTVLGNDIYLEDHPR